MRKKGARSKVLSFISWLYSFLVEIPLSQGMFFNAMLAVCYSVGMSNIILTF